MPSGTLPCRRKADNGPKTTSPNPALDGCHVGFAMMATEVRQGQHPGPLCGPQAVGCS